MIPKRIAGATRYLGAPKGWEPEADGDCSQTRRAKTPKAVECEASQSGAESASPNTIPMNTPTHEGDVE